MCRNASQASPAFAPTKERRMKLAGNPPLEGRVGA
jgi:hypothetical protein